MVGIVLALVVGFVIGIGSWKDRTEDVGWCGRGLRLYIWGLCWRLCLDRLVDGWMEARCLTVVLCCFVLCCVVDTTMGIVYRSLAFVFPVYIYLPTTVSVNS